KFADNLKSLKDFSCQFFLNFQKSDFPYLLSSWSVFLVNQVDWGQAKYHFHLKYDFHFFQSSNNSFSLDLPYFVFVIFQSSNILNKVEKHGIKDFKSISN
uniref:Uncharacterized protein n=1 Tax=Clytia hemisphaerica TaxID=252671 RepID=A0A7M5WUT0_9CNID